MSCCSANISKKVRSHCPKCDEPCLNMSSHTLLHQVQFPDNQKITQDDYAFCPNHLCHVGYFSPSHMIPKQKLRAFKESQKAMLCYCFDISEHLYQSALESGTFKPIKEFVIQQTKLASCACETRNPSGRCCLAHFKDMEKSYGHR
ncbi:MAG: hypothetical protein Q9M19_02250 [Mariprofundaceae bacterium]|nr:hypothetical protein [Mariprofundaceae bacterium]